MELICTCLFFKKRNCTRPSGSCKLTPNWTRNRMITYTKCIKCFLSTLRRRNSRTKCSFRKRFKCFPSTLRRRNFGFVFDEVRAGKGVLNGPIQFESVRKIWPSLELLAKIRKCSLARVRKIFCKRSHARIFVKIPCSVA